MANDVRTRARQQYERVRDTAHSLATRDIALLVARICLAWIFVYHGAGTLFGAFGGAGIHNEAVYFATVAHLRPGTFFAVLGGIIECFGGAAVGLGLFGRLAAAGLAGDMIMAMITVTFSQGLVGDASGIGYQLNLALSRTCRSGESHGHGSSVPRLRPANVDRQVPGAANNDRCGHDAPLNLHAAGRGSSHVARSLKLLRGTP